MKDLLKQGITEALNKAMDKGTLPAGDYPSVALEVPPQKEFGDFASNIAMQSARVAHKAPKLIAQAIVDEMDYPWLERAEIAGAGFINFFLKNDVIYDTLKQILAAGDAYGHAPLREDDSVQVEYVSANPTGPLHVGHGRGAAYGSTLVNLLRAAGYNVQAEYYINDAGNQMNNLAASVNARYHGTLGPAVGDSGKMVITATISLKRLRPLLIRTAINTSICRKKNGLTCLKTGPMSKS